MVLKYPFVLKVERIICLSKYCDVIAYPRHLSTLAPESWRDGNVVCPVQIFLCCWSGHPLLQESCPGCPLHRLIGPRFTLMLLVKV